MRKLSCLTVLALAIALCACAGTEAPAAPSDGYAFRGGYPTPDTVQRAYDDADMARAIEAYKVFYPTVSMAGLWKGTSAAGAVPNSVFVILQGSPAQLVFTPNSDTPYGGGLVDLSGGPMVVDVPPGPLMGLVNDLNQRYVMDIGLSGPDAGKGGRHVILPPGYGGPVPDGHSGRATTNRVLLMFRSIPPAGNIRSAISLLKNVSIRPLDPPADWKEPTWFEMGDRPADLSPLRWERGLDYWKELHEIVDKEPVLEAYRMEYGRLSSLGIEKGKAFAPDARMREILEKAAQLANDQLRVRALADRRADRLAWEDRQWEWVSLRPENGTFDLPTHKDLDAREKWFFQAVFESPAMFSRDASAGSLSWLGSRDGRGAYLDGGRTYRLRVPLPAPAKLLWSVTVYDTETRSEIATDQRKAALRSLYELKHKIGSYVDLYFGPAAPAGHQDEWIQTVPGKGWFAYFRIYGPEKAAFDGTWKPGDFEETR